MPPCSHHDEKVPWPIAQLRAEHEVILRPLTVLEQLGQKLEDGKTVDWNIWARLTDFFTTFVDRCHHGKEEQSLFTLLEQHGIARESGPVGIMLQEHEQGRVFLRSMALDTESERRRTAEAIRNYLALLQSHMKKEIHVPFGMAEQMLSRDVLQDLSRSFKSQEGTEVGEGVHERFLRELKQLETSYSKSSSSLKRD